jgi:hypothetical protein
VRGAQTLAGSSALMLLPRPPAPGGQLPPRYLLTGGGASPGLRHRARSQLVAWVRPSHPRLRRGFGVATGRGSGGGRTVFSKGHRARHATFLPLHRSGEWLHRLGMLVGFVPRGRGPGFVGLLHTAVGAWTHLAGGQHGQLLAYVMAVPRIPHVGPALHAQPCWLWPLGHLAPHTRVSQVGPVGAAPRFSLAAGSTCLLLSPRVWGRWALLALPSGRLRFAGSAAYVFLGPSAPGESGLTRRLTAGARRNLGFCPQVRGTAQNPNDHPHGGRTRALRWQRTPWGRTAKRSRRPQGVPPLKVLTRRPVRPASARAPAPAGAPDGEQPHPPLEDEGAPEAV